MGISISFVIKICVVLSTRIDPVPPKVSFGLVVIRQSTLKDYNNWWFCKHTLTTYAVEDTDELYFSYPNLYKTILGIHSLGRALDFFFGNENKL